jgi:hypothetical protein
MAQTKSEFIDMIYAKSKKDLVLLAKKHNLMPELYKMRNFYMNCGFHYPYDLIIWLNSDKTEEEYIKWLMKSRKWT